MTKRKKIGMAFGALAMTLVVASASVGITMAAIIAQVGSSFNINYVAHNVEAIVTGSYTNNGGTQSGSLGDALVFSAADANGNKSFSKSPNIALDNEKDFIEFRYTIENKGDFGFGVSLELKDFTNTNFAVTYSSSYRTNLETEATYSYNSTEFKDAYVTPSGSNHGILDVGIKLTIVQDIQSGKAAGRFEFTLDALAESPIYLPAANDLKTQLLTTDANLNSITFDQYTSDNTYLVGGKNVLENAEVIDLHETSDTSSAVIDGVKLYKVTNDTKFDLYLLSEGKISLSGSAASLFESCTATKLDLNNLDTSSVTSMDSMFKDCSNLVQLNIKSFDTSSVTDMLSMFDGCSSLNELDVKSFNTSKVTRMSNMFNSCSSLNELDLTSFDISQIERRTSETGSSYQMTKMFYKCSSLTAIYASSLWEETAAQMLKSSKTGTKDVFTGCTSMPNYNSKNTSLQYDTMYLTFV